MTNTYTHSRYRFMQFTRDAGLNDYEIRDAFSPVIPPADAPFSEYRIAYLSGPISGYTGFKDTFEDAENIMLDCGFHVFNPAKVSPSFIDGENDESKYWAFMGIDLHVITILRRYGFNKENMIVTLPHWEKSRGSKIEVQLAYEIGLRVESIDVFSRGRVLR